MAADRKDVVSYDYDARGQLTGANYVTQTDENYTYDNNGNRNNGGLTLTGLQYNNARWYNPATQRWMSEDPIGFAGGDENLSRYVGNAPTIEIDPSGLANFWNPISWGIPSPNQSWGQFFNPVSELNRATLGGYYRGLAQGTVNSVNGVQDSGVALINLANDINPVILIVEDYCEIDLTIPSPDWSRNRFVYEEGWSHSLSKFAGGEGIITLATAGTSQIRHVEKARHVQWLDDAVNPRLVERLKAWRTYQESGGKMSMSQWVKHTQGAPYGTGFKSGYAKWIQSLESAHGNSRLSRKPATLYALFDECGNFLKWGVSHDPSKRYPASFLLKKRLAPFSTGPRSEMLRIERELIESSPGLLNKEPWAGLGK